MRNLRYGQIVEFHDQCHGPRARDVSAMAWAHRMEHMLGPDKDLKGFLIRSHVEPVSGMYLMPDGSTWTDDPRRAKQWSWGDTAVRITNNSKLEAIRVNNLEIAMDSKGQIIFRGKDKDG